MATTTLPKADLVRRYAAGESVRALAKEYGRNTSTMSENLRRWGAPMRSPAGFKQRRYTAVEKQRLLDAYQGGATAQVLADANGVTLATMLENLHNWGADLRRTGPSRKYTLNEDYFAEVVAETPAYWLGFALADGCVQQVGAGNWIYSMRLQRRDRDHLATFLQAIGSDAPITDYTQTTKLGKVRSMSRIEICSVAFCRHLIRLGCIPRKTCNHGTPSLAPHLYRHFYRGATDGDGSVLHIPQIHAWRWELTGAEEFIVAAQQWVMQNAAVRKTKLIRKKSRAITVRYTGGAQIERIARLLYQDATVYLPRKYDAYLALCDRRTKRGPR